MHQPITSDTSFDWECDSRPAPPPVLRELAEERSQQGKIFYEGAFSVQLSPDFPV